MCMNHGGWLTGSNTIISYTPFSFCEGCLREKETGLLVPRPFLAGSPHTVRVCPLGLPLRFTTGGTFRPIQLFDEQSTSKNIYTPDIGPGSDFSAQLKSSPIQVPPSQLPEFP
jgi:hypothetical protein